MKVTINKNDGNNKAEYPCLKIAVDDDIVLFYDVSKGVKISNPSGSFIGVGEYFEDYHMASFSPFTGSITLEND